MTFQTKGDGVNSIIHSHHHSLNTIKAPAHPFGKPLFSDTSSQPAHIKSHQSLQSNKSSSIQQDSGLPISNIHLPTSSFDPHNSGYDSPPPDHDTPSPEPDTQYPEDDAYPDYGTQYLDYNAQYQEYLTKYQDDDTQYQDDNNDIAQIQEDDTQYIFGDTPSPICESLNPTPSPNTSQKSDYVSPSFGFAPSQTLDYDVSTTNFVPQSQKFSPQISDYVSSSFGFAPSQTLDYDVSTTNFVPQSQKFSPQKSDYVPPSLGPASSQKLDYGVPNTNFLPQTQKFSSQKLEPDQYYANHSPATPNVPPYNPTYGQPSPRYPSQTLGFVSAPQQPQPQTLGFSLPVACQQHPLQSVVRPPPIPSPRVKTVAPPSLYYGSNLKKSLKTSTPNTDTTTQYSDPLRSNSARENQFLKPIGDSDSIDAMVLAAKTGKWNTVWSILDGKPHIVNCIPKERAWSALHQAAYHNNENSVWILLQYPDCDPEIKTKQDRNGKFGPSKAPMDLTKSQEVKAMLTNKIQQNNSMFHSNSPKPTLIQMSEFGKPMGRCIYLTLECCKGFLIPKESRVSHISIDSLPHVMKLEFSFINCENNWILAKDNVSLTLQQYSIELGNLLWTGDKSKGAESRELNSDRKTLFFIRAITLYTGERKKLHKTVNDMLRNQAHKPTSLELSLGPYAMLLNSILMEWNELKPYQGTTYRACQLSEEEAETYFRGQVFAWLSFSSSSKIQRLPCNYLFIIDNRFSAKWAPREIMHYSEFPSEQECLYAFGAKFKVTSVDKLSKKICLILIDNN